MVKDSAIVVDGGYSKVAGKVVGDTVAEDMTAKASFFVPAVGGVGPMTVAMLLVNTVKSFERSIKR